MRRLAVLRPEPGNGNTSRSARARGFDVLQLALFEVTALDWPLPDLGAHDGLLLTSANALRYGGPGLAALRTLPVVAVGAATANAATNAGFDVMITGEAGSDAVLERAGTRFCRLLHLGGAETTITPLGGVARSVAVYAARRRDIAAEDARALAGTTALLHSPRAAAALRAVLAGAGVPTAELDIACLSSAIATAAGTGWRGATVAAVPTDDALLQAVAMLDD